MPLLSFIIPLYNTEKYIAACLSSILDNDANKALYEVIVVNDGSTDSSPTIVKSFCDRIPNISLLNQENQGVSVARMNGVTHSKGDYIWFIDSDDYVTPTATAEILDTICSNSDIDVFVTPMYLSYDDGREGFATHQLKKRYTISGKELMKDKDFFLIGPPQFIVRRSLFQDKWLTFPKGIRYEDEYYARVLKYQAARFLILEKYKYVYRQWDGSHMHSIGIDGAYDIVEVYRRLSEFGDNCVAQEDQEWYRYNIVSFLLESYTRFPQLLRTEEFESFKEENGKYIRSEMKKYRHSFPLKDRFLAWLLLSSPYIYTSLIRQIRKKKKN